jgi:uncharacterized protein (TIGR02246 family)
MSADEQAIRQVAETWMRASREGDAEIVPSLMTKDAVFMVPGREVFAAAAGASPKIEGTSQIVEIQVLGDWAFTRKHIDLTATPPGGSPVRLSG